MAAAGGPRLDTAYVSLQLGEGGLEGEEKNRSKTIWRVSKKFSALFQKGNIFFAEMEAAFQISKKSSLHAFHNCELHPDIHLLQP